MTARHAPEKGGIAMIETHGLTKVYKNGFKAVDGLDLKIGEGDIFGFLGPNGAGKTTTLSMEDIFFLATGEETEAVAP